MIKDNEKPIQTRMKQIVFLLCFILSICFMQMRAEAATLTSYCSSDNKESYYTLKLEQDRIMIEGHTTEDLNGMETDIWTIDDKTVLEGRAYHTNIVNGTYHDTYKLPADYGKPKDGLYQIQVQIKSAQGMPYIIVKDGVASFYQNERYDTDLIGDEFIHSIDPGEIFDSEVYTSTFSDENMNMTDSQYEELCQLAQSTTKGIQSDYEKAKAVYQWITENIYYDTASAALTDGNGDNNPYSVYKNRYAVCEGYVRLYVELLHILKIPATAVLGYAKDAPTDKEGGHAWAVVYADGRWFYADPTWDSWNEYVNKSFNKGNAYLHYFDISLSALSENHHILNIEAGVNQDGFNIDFCEEHVTVNDYTGTESVVVFPSKFKKLQITQVSYLYNDVFNNNVKQIIVPDGYEKLTNYAFQKYAAINAVSLPNSIKEVGKCIFQNTVVGFTVYCVNSAAVINYCTETDTKLVKAIPAYLDYKNYNLAGKLVNIKNANVTIPDIISYTGKATEPNLLLKLNGTILKLGKDYVINCENNDAPGDAIAIIHGIGNYIGELRVKYVIVPQSVSINLTSKKSKSVTISWEPAASAKGYEIYYSTSKNGKYKKLMDVDSVKYTTSGLKSGQTYYFKVRAYLYSDNDKKYGEFSEVKSITVK